jgi:putative tricarboxylic transport membrane protein
MSQMMRKISAERIAGVVFIFLGVISLIESFRLRPLRIRDAVGDDTFPLILGVVLLALGILKTFIIREPHRQVTFPRGRLARKIIGSMATLFVYWACLEFLGYLVSTFLCSTVLFKLFGDYRWRTCVIASVLLTGSLYLIFIRFLKMPFPVGIFGF